MRKQRGQFFDRIAQEEFEEQFLSPYACKSSQSKGRRREERNICSLRTAFQRDRDRIVHCKAFRRLKHKTQVFIAPFGDHYRTRLTHTLEVSQIARTIARALRLNEDLAEAISLGHDLGHTPFGHTGEEALNDVYKANFQHNKQSLRVIDKLEREGEGINLTWEVRDGILNHSQDKEKILTPKSRNQPGTLEGEVVKIADALAYVNHDIDDAMRAKIIREKDLPRESLKILGRTHRERINTLVQNIVKESWQVSRLKMGDIVLDSFNELRDFMYDKVYLSSFLFDETRKAYRIVSELYSFYLRETHLLPISLRKNIDKEGQERIVTDYIAGMTDRFAINIYKNYFIPEGWK